MRPSAILNELEEDDDEETRGTIEMNPVVKDQQTEPSADESPARTSAPEATPPEMSPDPASTVTTTMGTMGLSMASTTQPAQAQPKKKCYKSWPSLSHADTATRVSC